MRLGASRCYIYKQRRGKASKRLCRWEGADGGERGTVVSGGIYLVQGDGGLVEMSEQEYASEDLL